MTGKPLGVTGEVAELEAATRLNLQLCTARTPLYDAIDTVTGRTVQVKGRAVDRTYRYKGMCPSIKIAAGLDDVVLVLFDRSTLQAIEIWRARVDAIADRASKFIADRRRIGNILAIAQFRALAVKVWERSE